jgi:hypothetical protein
VASKEGAPPLSLLDRALVALVLAQGGIHFLFVSRVCAPDPTLEPRLPAHGQRLAENECDLARTEEMSGLLERGRTACFVEQPVMTARPKVALRAKKERCFLCHTLPPKGFPGSMWSYQRITNSSREGSLKATLLISCAATCAKWRRKSDSEDLAQERCSFSILAARGNSIPLAFTSLCILGLFQPRKPFDSHLGPYEAVGALFSS